MVETDYERLVPTCIDTRAVKVKIEKIDIPVGYAAAFEGERVRKDDMQVQFGFKYSDAVEYVHMVDGGEIEDGRIEVSGPGRRLRARRAAPCRWRSKCWWPGGRCTATSRASSNARSTAG